MAADETAALNLWAEALTHEDTSLAQMAKDLIDGSLENGIITPAQSLWLLEKFRSRPGKAGSGTTA